MNLRWCESPSNAARIAVLSADQAPTAIIACPHLPCGKASHRHSSDGNSPSLSTKLLAAEKLDESIGIYWLGQVKVEAGFLRREAVLLATVAGHRDEMNSS